MEEKKYTFIVSDESLNKYGYRVLTDGIDLEEFKKNPVLFWNHHRSDDFTGNTDVMPIGRWENLRVEDGRLIAEAVIDQNDELGKKLISKLDQGFINAASIGIEVGGTSEKEADLIEGQSRPTITKSILQEISIVDIPANRNAMRLSFSGAMLNLNNKEDMEKLNKELPKIEEDKVSAGIALLEFIKTLGAALGGRLMELIDAYAEANDMTLEDVREAAGSAAGVSGDTVANIESGEINCPPVERLEGFAEFFGVSLEYLLELAAADGCEYELKYKEESKKEEQEETQELKSEVRGAVGNFLESLKANFKIVKKDKEGNSFADLISTLKTEVLSFNKDITIQHEAEKEELLSTIEILKAELDLSKEKHSDNESLINKLKEQNKEFISGATITDAEPDTALLSDKEEEIEETELQKAYNKFGALAQKHFNKKT